MYEPTDVITDVDELQRILGEKFHTQENKIIDHIDEHCRTWIERTPFIVIASANAAGIMDVSPKGDPPGFVQVLDPHTLAIPDRLGNHRGDTFKNVIENPEVSIVFAIPMRTEVVRVGGRAQVVRDAALLDSMVVNGKRPDLALVVRVREAFFHCGKAMIRSRMWKPDLWESIEGLPSYAQALKDHGNLPDTLENLEERMANNERNRLY